MAQGRGEKLPSLRRLRYSKGMRQVDLSARAGLNRSTVAQIETGKPADAETIRKLADALGVDAAELMKPVDPD